ncbi:C2 domain containing protein [Oryctes borbonicus]|uniref:C2 domain containing protein n=1 Tax=Oryctes borbonicus TaxID=1629725 RepID=A0A0T6AY15_9SCAR|nr:C2 domain containing protein [Oryctes borbonicus]
MASAVTDKVKERRSRVFLEPLPNDFLRVAASVQQQQEAADRQAALALHQQYLSAQPCVTNIVGRLSICVAQAKLAKNYGMVRMDPYARVRVGHCVYETHTDTNGGKNPRWNKVVQCLLPQGVNMITIEIYDERSFTMDELIAWTQINIPQQIFSGETHEDWYALSGKQGEGVEGMINLVLSYNPQPPLQPLLYAAPNVSAGQMQTMAIYPAPPTAQTTVPVLSESELKQIEEMFPNIDKEVIKSVFEANRGNKDGTINSLLQMCE